MTRTAQPNDPVPVPGTGALSGRTMDHRRRSRLIDVFVAITAVATVGLLLDVWIVVWMAIPAFATVLLLQGTLSHRDHWERGSLAAALGFCAVLVALFAAVAATEPTDAMLWGMPLSMGFVFYVILPYTAVGSGLLYALIFARSLRHDVLGGE